MIAQEINSLKSLIQAVLLGDRWIAVRGSNVRGSINTSNFLLEKFLRCFIIKIKRIATFKIYAFSKAKQNSA